MFVRKSPIEKNIKVVQPSAEEMTSVEIAILEVREIMVGGQRTTTTVEILAEGPTRHPGRDRHVEVGTVIMVGTIRGEIGQ
jgi:hypothetical protein